MKNAIERCLDKLHDQWVEFSAQPQPRVLRWLIRDDEYRVIETFLMKESDDRAGELPDVFLRFDEPFIDVNQYGAALLDALTAQYGIARDELEADGEVATWQAPAVEPESHSLTTFLAAATSLHEHYAHEMEQLVLVLTPSSTTSRVEWQRWLLAVAPKLSGSVRIILLDYVDEPELDAFCAQAGPLAVTTKADLAMPEAIAELARAGGTSQPDGQFRVHFTALTQAIGAGETAQIDDSAGAALAIAQENGWTHLIGAVHMAVAAASLSAGKPLEAVLSYREVDAAGQQMAQTGEPIGTTLQLQAAFATGAAYISVAAWPDAAVVYEGAVVQATAAEDALMLLEAWRMAGYCHEQAREHERAWACGQQALAAGKNMPADQRATSTLPYAGEALLRLATNSGPHSAAVEQWMTALMGTPDWRPAQQEAG